MRDTKNSKLLRPASVVFLAAPVLLSIVAMASARHDFRWFWMSLASLPSALAARRLVRSSSVSTTWTAMLITGTVLAAAVAYLLGARAASGIWMVSIVIAGCWATGLALRTIASR